jgi:hypothetical protein
MKKKIICIGIIGLFLLMTVSSSSTGIIKTKQVDDLNDDPVYDYTVDVFLYLDANGNENFDDGETPAGETEFWISEYPFGWGAGRAYGTTDEFGKATIEFQWDWNNDYWDLDSEVGKRWPGQFSDYWRGSVQFDTDGAGYGTVSCGLEWIEEDTHVRSLIKSFSLDRFPLLKRLLNH